MRYISYHITSHESISVFDVMRFNYHWLPVAAITNKLDYVKMSRYVNVISTNTFILSNIEVCDKNHVQIFRYREDLVKIKRRE